ncbi:hypothetical protein [Schlegelella aquatica]|uniref:hypothetical protein n=1 Tax=Caldimonas aquatica TaxID=376175 RepID=UPI00374FE29C
MASDIGMEETAMWTWTMGLKLGALVGLVLGLIAIALEEAMPELLLALVAIPAAAAVSSGLAAFLDLDR